jgi:hypothetical protein
MGILAGVLERYPWNLAIFFEGLLLLIKKARQWAFGLDNL